MKKIIFALASAVTVSALSGCGSDPEDVALGMVKAIVNGDAEKAASYCSPEEKTRCNIKGAKFVIEQYREGLSSMKAYYDKAADPEYQIGQKKHEDYSKMGGPVVSEILVIDVKNRPGSKDDPSDYTFKFVISDKGAVGFPRYKSWESSSEEPLNAAAKTKKWVEPIVTEKYTLTNEQLAQKFDAVLSGKEKPSEGEWRDERPFMKELYTKFKHFNEFVTYGTDWQSDRLSKLAVFSSDGQKLISKNSYGTSSSIVSTLNAAMEYTTAMNPKTCFIVVTDDKGKSVPNKDYNWREDNSQYTRYECDKDGQNYLFQRFKDYLLKDEPSLIKKYSAK